MHGEGEDDYHRAPAACGSLKQDTQMYGSVAMVVVSAFVLGIGPMLAIVARFFFTVILCESNHVSSFSADPGHV